MRSYPVATVSKSLRKMRQTDCGIFTYACVALMVVAHKQVTADEVSNPHAAGMLRQTVCLVLHCRARDHAEAEA